MKIQRTLVSKILVSDIENLDPVAIYLEDLSDEHGKLTVTCFGESWSHSWGAMGEDVKIREFLRRCDRWYIAKKLSPQTQDRVVDTDALESELRKEILRQRSQTEISKEKAREIWNLIETADFSNYENDTDALEALSEVYGCEWWHALPMCSSPQYEYLLRIVDVLKAVV